MSESVTLRKLRDRFADSIIEIHSKLGEDTAVMSRSSLLAVAAFLKEEPDLDFNFLMDVTAVDLQRNPRFEVVYHFYSLAHNYRLRLKVPVRESDAEVESLTSLYSSANWFEREVFDMFGVRFKGHPDLRRILMYDGFEGHPLRKDYPFDKRQPLIGSSE